MPLEIFLTISLAVLVLLLLPVRLHISADNFGELCGAFKVSYGFRLISYDYSRHGSYSRSAVRVLGLTISGFGVSEKDTSRKRDKKGVHSRELRWFRKLRPYLPGIIRDILYAIKGKEASVHLKLGFDDPAYTGMAAGLMSCVTGRLGETVRYTPDFSGENFEVDLRIYGVIIPIAMIFIGIKYLTIYLWDRIPGIRNVKGGRKYEFNG